jgi:hypothetical protein
MTDKLFIHYNSIIVEISLLRMIGFAIVILLWPSICSFYVVVEKFVRYIKQYGSLSLRKGWMS